MIFKAASGPYGESLTLHHQKSALQLQRVSPRGQPHRHTINIEIAHSISFQPDWEVPAEKKLLQVSLTELPGVAAVLLGLIPEIRNSFHGENKNRGYEVVNTEKNRVWALTVPSEKRYFNFTHDETFWLADFTLGALAANTHGRNLSDVMNLLRQTYSRRKPPAA